MAAKLEEFYEVQKKDMKRAGTVFASAFKEDPVWKKVFSKGTEKQRSAFFESPARFCRKYGNLYSPSEKLEGMAGWAHSKDADMTALKALLCGSIGSSLRAGMVNLKDMMTIFEPLDKARKEHMKGRDYLYLMILGIAREHQAKGHGGRLMRAILDQSREMNLPIYLETSTEKNVAMYEHYGFRQVGKVIHPIIDLPQWCLIREPQ